MDKKKFKEWLEKFGKAWIDRNPNKISPLFEKKLEYFESALEKPVTTLNSVLDLWKLVPDNQDNIQFSFEIVAINGDVCVANRKVSRRLLKTNTNQTIDGIFVIKLNENKKCIYFKQRRTVK